MFSIDGDMVKFGETIVGEVTEAGLELNLAWMRLAGTGLIVFGDKQDARRVVMNRPAKNSKKAEDVEAETL